MPDDSPTNFELGPHDRDLYLKAGAVPRLKLSTDGVLSAVNGGSIRADTISSPVLFAVSWVTPAYSAGTYTGSGSMTVTVAAGDVITNSYIIMGKLMLWRLEISPFSIGGTPSNQVRIALPAGVTVSGATGGAYHFVDNGNGGIGLWEVSHGGATANFFLTATGSTWAASTDGTAIRAVLILGLA